MPAWRAASKIVLPCGAVICCPSIVKVTFIIIFTPQWLIDYNSVKFADFCAQATTFAQFSIYDVWLAFLAANGVAGTIAPAYHASGAQLSYDFVGDQGPTLSGRAALLFYVRPVFVFEMS